MIVDHSAFWNRLSLAILDAVAINGSRLFFDPASITFRAGGNNSESWDIIVTRATWNNVNGYAPDSQWNVNGGGHK